MPPMKRRMSIAPGQPEKEVVSVEVTSAKEFWNEYIFEDGTIFKAKTILSEVWRVEGEWDAEGNPIYIAKANLLPNAIPAENLKRPPQQPSEPAKIP